MDKNLTYDELLFKMAARCSAGEKCSHDISEKLAELGANADVSEKIVAYLRQEKYIDDERFASAFVRDKFRFAKWGKIKIAYMLKMKKISDFIVQNALSEISDDEYAAALADLLAAKRRTTKARDRRDLRTKLIRFAQSRGFEYPAVCAALADLPVDDDEEE